MTVLLTDPEDVALLERLASDSYAANGVPGEALAADRAAGAALAADALAGVLVPGGLRTSPLGPGWSQDLDCHVGALPDHRELLEAGWLPLDPVLRRLRRPGEDRWAVTGHGRVLAGVDLHLDPPPPALSAVLDRCRRRGEVRLREVLELRQLSRTGVPLPADEVIEVAADIEHALGCSLLARWRTGTDRPCPAPLPASRAARALRQRLSAVRGACRPRLVVALSGADGAGKSTLATELTAAFERCGLPSGRVWTRPGLAVTPLHGLRQRLKRLLKEEGRSGLQRRAADPEARLRTRTGLLGFAWSLVVTVAFLRDAWRQYLRARGIVVFDRHVVDALVTLELVYGGSDLRLHAFLVRHLLPRAHVALYLAVDPALAVQRKPEDFFTVESLGRQVDGYERHLATMAGVHRLDSGDPPGDLARRALDLVLSDE